MAPASGQPTRIDKTGLMTDPIARRSARDLGPDDLVWDHFSRPRADGVAERVYAAAAAGYAAIGLYLGAWATLREQPAELERVDEALASTGLVVANIETLRGWAVPGNDEACRKQEALAYEMAAHWGCRYVQVSELSLTQFFQTSLIQISTCGGCFCLKLLLTENFSHVTAATHLP